MKECSYFGRSSRPLTTLLAVAAFCAVGSGRALGGPIHDAAKAGDLTRVSALLKDNPDLVSSKDKDGATPLHSAASLGRAEVAALLLAQKADINAKDNDGNTPLHLVAYVKILSAAEAAGQALADKMFPGDTKSEAKASPVTDSSKRQQDTLALLLANKADVNARNNDGRAPLQMAAILAGKDMVKTLLASGADVNAKANDGMTALHLAAMLPAKDVVELLLANKADVNAKDNTGATPLHLAIAKGQKDIADLLRQHGGKE